MPRTTSVLFVCTGNICRSPLAEELLRVRLQEFGAGGAVTIDSAGTHADHLGDSADSRMRTTASRHGVRIQHRARRVTRADLERFDLVIGMDDRHLSTLHRLADGRRPLIRKLREFDPQVSNRDAVPDVPDPWYGDMDGFERVYEMVDRSCTALAGEIAARLSDRREIGT